MSFHVLFSDIMLRVSLVRFYPFGWQEIPMMVKSLDEKCSQNYEGGNYKFKKKDVPIKSVAINSRNKL